MKKQLNMVLLLALATGTLATTAKAQSYSATTRRSEARIEYATFNPDQTNARLERTQVAVIVHPRHHYRHYRPAGYYDRWGRWHPYGYYDRYGYWHQYR